MSDGRIQTIGGKILTVDGRVATADECCANCFEETECICCNFLWDTSLYTGDWVVDFGVGGWTDVLCNYCDQINGEFILRQQFPFGCGPWVFRFDNACTFDCQGCNSPVDPPVFVDLVITLALVPDLVGEECFGWDYRLTVNLTWDFNPLGCPGGGLVGSSAFYIRGGGLDDCFQRLDPVTGKMSMPKFVEGHTTAACVGAGVLNTCTGALPNPVFAWPESVP